VIVLFAITKYKIYFRFLNNIPSSVYNLNIAIFLGAIIYLISSANILNICNSGETCLSVQNHLKLITDKQKN